MKFKKIIMSALLAAGCLTATAQEKKTIEVFNPHWYVQGQFGGQYTLGETKFKDLLSLNAQVAGGYQFTSVWGLRLAVNGWQSKGGSDYSYSKVGNYKWKWNYIAPNLDATINLTNLFGGYKYNRLVNVSVFAGIGCNIGFNNTEARDVKQAYQAATNGLNGAPEAMQYLWAGHSDEYHTTHHAWVQGHFGADVDFRISDRVSVGVEAAANVLSDHYNSKKAGNADWYFNLLAGVKVNLGKTHKSKEIECPGRVIERVVEKIVEKPVEKIVEKVVEAAPVTNTVVVKEPLRRDIFFNICNSTVSKTEMPKVEDIVTYMNKYPQSKVTITGYADKGTGKAAGNMTYSQKRAQMVADLLTKSYGIAANRITVTAKGDTEQPYDINELNRVSICIAE